MKPHPWDRRFLQRAAWLICVSLATVATTAGAQKPQAEEPAATVGMTNTLKFDPRSVTIRAGQTVLWKNTSDIPHTVTADPEKAKDKSHVHLPEGAKPFNSGTMKPGASFRHIFKVPGKYKYFCIPHEAAGMIATVEVKPAP